MKKIALACTGGGIKACVNIGVLRALDELNIEVEAISGASLGGLVALMHCLNYSPEEMLEIFEKDVIKFENFNILDILCAVPLLFTPHKVKMEDKNHFMLDGGILTNTLVTPLRQFSDYIIGITNKFYPQERSRINLGTGFVQTFQAMRRSYLWNEKQNSDLWIQIDGKMNRFVGSSNEVKHFENLRLYNYDAMCKRILFR